MLIPVLSYFDKTSFLFPFLVVEIIKILVWRFPICRHFAHFLNNKVIPETRHMHEHISMFLFLISKFNLNISHHWSTNSLFLSCVLDNTVVTMRQYLNSCPLVNFTLSVSCLNNNNLMYKYRVLMEDFIS